jgi:hypothetical protein
MRTCVPAGRLVQVALVVLLLAGVPVPASSSYAQVPPTPGGAVPQDPGRTTSHEAIIAGHLRYGSTLIDGADVNVRRCRTNLALSCDLPTTVESGPEGGYVTAAGLGIFDLWVPRSTSLYGLPYHSLHPMRVEAQSPGAYTDRDLAVESPSVIVRGAVRDSQGQPVPGAQVKFFLADQTLRGPLEVASTFTSTNYSTYLYNLPCSTAGNYNCNPNYPNNYGCVVGGLYPCTSSSGYGIGQYLYNTPCTTAGNYNCNPNYPNNYGCVTGSLYPCTNSSTYGSGQYLYNTPCSTAGNYDCNPQYPNNYGCVVGGLYPCASSSIGTSYYLYASTSCSVSPPPNCNPQYPNTTAICTPGQGYTCTTPTTYGTSYYLYANTPCTSTTPPPNCNPSYPNTTAICTPGQGYTCTSSSGTSGYFYNVPCTDSTGYNCNPNYPNNFGCTPGGLYPCATADPAPTSTYQVTLAPGSYRAAVVSMGYAPTYACCLTVPVTVTTSPTLLDLTVGPGTTFTGHATLAGSNAMYVPLKVMFVKADTQEVIRQETPFWSSNGTFTVQNVPAGTFDVWLKVQQYVAVVARQVTFTLGSPTSWDFGMLPAGDADHNDRVTAGDFSVLKATFGQTGSCASYWLVTCADFDGNGTVSPNDFTLLKQNFGAGSP